MAKWRVGGDKCDIGGCEVGDLVYLGDTTFELPDTDPSQTYPAVLKSLPPGKTASQNPSQ